MKVFKLIMSTAIAITMAVTLILTTSVSDHLSPPPQPSKPAAARPASRFLQQKAGNPRAAADHCNKENEVCNRSGLAGKGKNATCCNNKCMDLENDEKNCGACKKKCASAESCCGGECVNLAHDTSHCGSCHDMCMPGGNCIFGMCDYA
ncbi:hypothetical protein OROMI_024686 [Orobanche minor]